MSGTLLMGRPGSGKTTTALAHAAAHLGAGSAVVWVDCDGTPPGQVLSALVASTGMPAEKLTSRLRFIAAPDTVAALGRLCREVAAPDALVVLDSRLAAMATMGVPDTAAGFAAMGRALAPLHKGGALVVTDYPVAGAAQAQRAGFGTVTTMGA